MIFLKAILLAVVEGVTEFLPISSTGHLILLDQFVLLSADKAFTDTFIIVIQAPAILSVVLYFWKELWPFAGDMERRRETVALWFKIAAAFAPAAVLGVLLDKHIEALLSQPSTVAVALIVGGIILIILERRHKAPRILEAARLNYWTALGIGFFQCLAMIPGTSRSAATIIGAMLLGASRPVAAEFSFFLAIPTMLAATGYKLVFSGASFTVQQWAALAVGGVVSFITAYGVVAFLMHYIRRHDFQLFGYYRIVLGAIVLVYFWLFAGGQ